MKIKTAPSAANARSIRNLLLVLGVLLLARLLTLGTAPLFDATEGRYAEIGREMAVSGDWITPTLHGGVPFWAKPPLHFWATAASIRLFGVNEWAVRLPSFLASIGILLITGMAGARLLGRDAGRLSVVLLGSCGLFFILSGAVLLDVTFTFTITGALGCFALFSADRTKRLPGLLFFLFVGLGLLAKGPVVLVLVFLPVAAWSVWTRQAGTVRALPWFLGIPVVLLVAAPWYILAERKTPGFWNYFFIHEHILRYLKKEYGDLYGHGHVSPYGLIWLLGFASFLPWSPAILSLGRRHWNKRKENAGSDRTVPFLWIWSLSGLLFFTLSRSLSLPYVFPSLPPFALLLARGIAERPEGRLFPRPVLFLTPVLLLAGGVYAASLFPFSPIEIGTLVLPLLILIGILLFAVRRGAPFLSLGAQIIVFPLFILALLAATPEGIGLQKSTRHLAEAVESAGGAWNGRVAFFDGVPPSAEFYFGGEAANLKGSVDELRKIAESGGTTLFLREDREERIPVTLRVDLHLVEKSGRYAIYRVGSEETNGVTARPVPETAPEGEGTF